jgi:hypothetical protein
MERNGSLSELIKKAFITQLIHSFHSHQINKYLHRVVYSGTQESKAQTYSYNHAICMSITAFLKRYIRDQAICTIEAAAEQSESTKRAASRHQQRMHMPMVAHFQRWHFAPAPPFPHPPKKFNDNILLQWLQIFSCPKRQQKTEAAFSTRYARSTCKHLHSACSHGNTSEWAFTKYHFKEHNSKMEKDAQNVDGGVGDKMARLQPEQSPKRIGNIFTAGLKTLILNIPFYF